MNARELQFALRSHLSRSARLYRFLLRVTGSPRRDCLATRHSSIVVDGFPRSGNTYAVSALLAANPEVGHVARHIHLPVQFRIAQRYGIPAVLLLRHPVDAVVSLLIREPALSARFALCWYARFHTAVLPWRDHILAADFNQLVRNPYDIYRAVNRKFAAPFATPAMSAPLEEKIRRQVLDMDRRDRRDGASSSATSGLPNPERETLKARVRDGVLRAENRRWIDDAQRLYENWMERVEPVPHSPSA